MASEDCYHECECSSCKSRLHAKRADAHYESDHVQEMIDEARRGVVGEIGAMLLSKQFPQPILDAYFDAANEVIEEV